MDMVNIQLSDDQYDKLTQVVRVAGYSDVTSFLAALSAEPTEDPRGEMSEAELQDSISMIERGHSDINEGKGIEVDKAFQKIADKHGFDLS